MQLFSSISSYKEYIQLLFIANSALWLLHITTYQATTKTNPELQEFTTPSTGDVAHPKMYNDQVVNNSYLVVLCSIPEKCASQLTAIIPFDIVNKNSNVKSQIGIAGLPYRTLSFRSCIPVDIIAFRSCIPANSLGLITAHRSAEIEFTSANRKRQCPRCQPYFPENCTSEANTKGCLKSTTSHRWLNHWTWCMLSSFQGNGYWEIGSGYV